VAIPEHDRIVPPDVALPLARALPRAEIVRPPCGHITMVVGKRARRQLWEPLLAWLNTLGALQKTP
jgi:poly(3-hydroxyalkanoate) synthetase